MHLTDKIVELRGLKNSQQRLYIKGEIFSIDNMVTKVSLVIAHWGIALFFLCSASPTQPIRKLHLVEELFFEE